MRYEDIVDKLPENDKPMYLIYISDGKTNYIFLMMKYSKNIKFFKHSNYILFTKFSNPSNNAEKIKHILLLSLKLMDIQIPKFEEKYNLSKIINILYNKIFENYDENIKYVDEII